MEKLTLFKVIFYFKFFTAPDIPYLIWNMGQIVGYDEKWDFLK